MEDSRDPRFSIENSDQADEKESAQPGEQTASEENPLPVDFYRPTPGQSEYSYLFDEQEEIDPYDYVMKKVQKKKKAPIAGAATPLPPKAEPASQTVPEKAAEPRPTVERDLSLEEPVGGEKKSLRESLGDLLRRVTNTARIRNEFVRGEHGKGEPEGSDAQEPENPADSTASDESAQPDDTASTASDENTQPDDAETTDLFFNVEQQKPESHDDFAMPQTRDLLEDEAEPEEPMPEEPEQPEHPLPERETEQPEPAVTEVPQQNETEIPQPSQELPKTETELPASPVKEKIDSEAARFAEATESENNAETNQITAAEQAAVQGQPKMQRVELLQMSEPMVRPEHPMWGEAAESFDQSSDFAPVREVCALCVEIDAETLFRETDLPEVRIESDGENYRELRLEYDAFTGRGEKAEIVLNQPEVRHRWLPFLNRKRGQTTERFSTEAEQARNAETAPTKRNPEPAAVHNNSAEIKRSGTSKREPAAKPAKKEKTDESDSKAPPADSAKVLRQRLSKEIRLVFLRMLATGLIGAILAAVAICARCRVTLPAWLVPSSGARSLALINLLAMVVCLVLCRSVISVGLLGFFKGQKATGADGAFSVAAIACTLQALIAVIRPDALASGSILLYAPVGALGLCGNLLGKLCMLLRTRENYAEFCAAPERLSLARLEEESRTQKIVDADVPGRLTIGVSNPTAAADFLRASFETDSSERNAERIFAFGFFGALAAAILSFFASQSNGYDAALASYTAVCCLCAPFTATLTVNLPLRRICRTLRKNGAAMLNGSAAQQFGETGCVVLRDEELFPADAVVLSGIKTLSDGRVDDAILDAAALLQEAGGPLRTVFRRVIRGQTGIVPRAEQVTAELGGFSGWVQGRRVFVGSSELMASHGITPPSRDYEEKNCPPGTVPVYLARGGELCALFTVEYAADALLCEAMQNAVQNGCDIAVLTTDSNLSAAMIAEKFSVLEDSVTMVPNTQSLQQGELQQEDLEQQTVTVRSAGAPVLRAVSGCIRAKVSFQLGVLLQMVGTLLGLVLIFVFCAAGSIAQIGTTEMMVFQLFWTAACLVIPSIKRF